MTTDPEHDKFERALEEIADPELVDMTCAERRAYGDIVRAYVAKLKTLAPKWISVTERLPTSDYYVIVWDGELSWIARFTRGKFIDAGDGEISDVTKWCHLPQDPED